MNLRNVLRAYSLLRQLSDDESALLETLRAMNDSERDLLVESLSPQPQKKSSKKTAGSKSGGKSKHAESLQQQISGRAQSVTQPPAAATADADNSDVRCVKLIGGEKGLEPCEERADHNVHHLRTHPGYHEFQPPATHAATGD